MRDEVKRRDKRWAFEGGGDRNEAALRLLSCSPNASARLPGVYLSTAMFPQ